MTIPIQWSQFTEKPLNEGGWGAWKRPQAASERQKMVVALLTVDLQRDFLEPGEGRQVASAKKAYCLNGVRQLLAHARQQDWLVAHVVTVHDGRRTMPARLQNGPQFCISGTDGQELIPGIRNESEPLVVKRSFSGYLNTSLHEVMSGIDAVVLAGVATDCCLKLTAFDAAERFGKKVYVPIESTSASCSGGYVEGLRTLAKSVACVLSLSDLIGMPAHLWDAAHLNPNDVERRAREWFKSQEERSLNGHGDVTIPPREPTRSSLSGQA